MDEDIQATPVRLTAPRPAQAQELPELSERFVQRFSAPARREIRRLIRVSPRVADLCDTYPGLLYALAVRHGSSSQRLSAMSAIETGAPLKAVARLMGLPMWLRKLPPEAFADLTKVPPQSASFTRQIAHRLPKNPKQSRMWLKSVQFAYDACGEEFAVWLASQPVFDEEFDPYRSLAVLAAYAWFSNQADSRAFKLIVVPWRPEISFDTAMCAAKSWFNRVRLVLQMPEGAITDPWLRPAQVNGFAIEALLTSDALLAEAQAMHNCADQYAERIVREKCRLFSVRRNGLRVATLEIGPHSREGGVLAVNQLKARHNMAVASDVWQAVYAWMATQPALKRMPPIATPERNWDQPAWWAMLAPYRNTHGGAPWLDPVASHLVFAGLDQDLCELARRGGVSSWLFT